MRHPEVGRNPWKHPKGLGDITERRVARSRQLHRAVEAGLLINGVASAWELLDDLAEASVSLGGMGRVLSADEHWSRRSGLNRRPADYEAHGIRRSRLQQPTNTISDVGLRDFELGVVGACRRLFGHTSGTEQAHRSMRPRTLRTRIPVSNAHARAGAFIPESASVTSLRPCSGGARPGRASIARPPGIMLIPLIVNQQATENTLPRATFCRLVPGLCLSGAAPRPIVPSDRARSDRRHLRVRVARRSIP